VDAVEVQESHHPADPGLHPAEFQERRPCVNAEAVVPAKILDLALQPGNLGIEAEQHANQSSDHQRIPSAPTKRPAHRQANPGTIATDNLSPVPVFTSFRLT
jgi:hypothetical protein